MAAMWLALRLAPGHGGITCSGKLVVVNLQLPTASGTGNAPQPEALGHGGPQMASDAITVIASGGDDFKRVAQSLYGAAGMGGGKPAATLKPLLLRVFGDLEGVWADAALQDILLKLPQPAMKVLLGCDELQVGLSCYPHGMLRV